MKLFKLPMVLAGLLLIPGLLFAQGSKIAIVDFERAIVESVEGTKASEKFNSKFEERKKDVEKRQKELEDAQNKLRTQERALSDLAKANLTKDIDRFQTELKRINEDAQKELGTLRDQLLRPVAEKATEILNAYAREKGYTLVIDASNPQNNVIWVNPNNDITVEFIKRIDVELAKAQKKPQG